MYEVTMPKLSDSMEIGKILKWRVKEGDAVREGDVLAEIESDKAVMELECFRDGVMGKVLRGDGSEVKVGEVIARIEEEKAEAEDTPPAPVPERAGDPVRGAAVSSRGSAPVAVQSPIADAPVPVPAEKRTGRARISPYARKLAELKGIDYSRIGGSGPGGRIVARDIEAMAPGAGHAEPGRPPSSPHGGAMPQPPSPEEELPPLDVTADEAEVTDASFRLKTQARRLVATNHSIPQFAITRGADVSALLARKAEFKREYGATVTHLVMRACLIALDRHPEINRSYDRGRVVQWKGVHLGLAVETSDGLTVPVLRHAGKLSFADLVEHTNALVEKARAGRLSIEERRHPSFTITNLGMFDVEHFTPIANWPSAVTLAVSSALPAAIVKSEAIRIGRLMKLTAACDHRVVEGASAARFMKTVSELLEDPDSLRET